MIKVFIINNKVVIYKKSRFKKCYWKKVGHICLSTINKVTIDVHLLLYWNNNVHLMFIKNINKKLINKFFNSIEVGELTDYVIEWLERLYLILLLKK